MNFFGAAYSKYAQINAQSSGQLAAFAHSPESALREMRTQEYKYSYELGHLLEMIVYDNARKSDLSGESYFCLDLKEPGDCIVAGIWAGEPIAKKKMTKPSKAFPNGRHDGRYETHNAWIDGCLQNPGKLPIAVSDYRMVEKMAQNILNIVIDFPAFGRIPVRDILSDANTQWQYAIAWESGGIRKKALCDAIWSDGTETMVFDFKSAASFETFERGLKYGYGHFQDLHYTEGAKTPNPMIFLVAEKTDDGLARAYDIDIISREYLRPGYDKICRDYAAWEAQGCPVKGWLDKKTVRIFVPKEGIYE